MLEVQQEGSDSVNGSPEEQVDCVNNIVSFETPSAGAIMSPVTAYIFRDNRMEGYSNVNDSDVNDSEVTADFSNSYALFEDNNEVSREEALGMVTEVTVHEVEMPSSNIESTDNAYNQVNNAISECPALFSSIQINTSTLSVSNEDSLQSLHVESEMRLQDYSPVRSDDPLLSSSCEQYLSFADLYDSPMRTSSTNEVNSENEIAYLCTYYNSQTIGITSTIYNRRLEHHDLENFGASFLNVPQSLSRVNSKVNQLHGELCKNVSSASSTLSRRSSRERNPLRCLTNVNLESNDINFELSSELRPGIVIAGTGQSIFIEDLTE